MFPNFTGKSGDDTGNSGGEGDGGETCRERQRWTKHESKTGPTQVRNWSPSNNKYAWKIWFHGSMNCLT